MKFTGAYFFGYQLLVCSQDISTVLSFDFDDDSRGGETQSELRRLFQVPLTEHKKW